MSTVAARSVVQQSRSGHPDSGKMSHEQVEALAETTARELLGVSAFEAFATLDRGELDGTFAASALRSLRFLLAA